MSLFGNHKKSGDGSLFSGSTGTPSPHHKFDWGAAALSFMGVDPNIFIGRRRQQDAEAQQQQVNAIIDADPNLSPQDKAYAKMNPKAYIDQRMKYYGPMDNGAAGGSRGELGPDGQMKFTMAPSRHEFQGSVFDVNGGPAGQPSTVTPQHEGTQWVTPQPGTTAFGVNSYSGARRSGEAAPVQPTGAMQGPDATPTIEDGHAYRPGPGGRANPANWIPLAQGGAGRSAPPTFP